MIFEKELRNKYSEQIIRTGSEKKKQSKQRANIFLVLETTKDRKYWIRLNTTIEHFNLPIDAWCVGNAAYSKY